MPKRVPKSWWVPETDWAVLTPAKHILPSAPTALVKNMIGNGDVARHPSRNIRPPSGPANRHQPCGARDVSSVLSGPDLMTVGVPAGVCGKEALAVAETQQS